MTKSSQLTYALPHSLFVVRTLSFHWQWKPVWTLPWDNKVPVTPTFHNISSPNLAKAGLAKKIEATLNNSEWLRIAQQL
jgi:hypothetical protein